MRGQPLSFSSPIQFLADAMLGRTARWLRLVGFDTIYASEHSDLEILRQADREHRIILTGDAALHQAAKHRMISSFLISSNDLAQQLESILGPVAENIDPGNLGSRCCFCNRELCVLSREQIGPYILGFRSTPPAILMRYPHFWLCFSCKRLFWPGSMWTRIQQQLERLTKIALKPDNLKR